MVGLIAGSAHPGLALTNLGQTYETRRQAGFRKVAVYGDPERIRTADLHLDRVAC